MIMMMVMVMMIDNDEVDYTEAGIKGLKRTHHLVSVGYVTILQGYADSNM